MKECNYDSYPKYKQVIAPLQRMAKELGYALAVHGTLKRDIDLIAVPWAASAVEASVLSEALRVVAAEVCGFAFIAPHENDRFHRAGCPGMKPHGRLCWSYHLGGGPYIDLSVVPRLSNESER